MDRLHVSARRSTYPALIGMAAASLVTGLLISFGLGDRATGSDRPVTASGTALGTEPLSPPSDSPDLSGEGVPTATGVSPAAGASAAGDAVADAPGARIDAPATAAGDAQPVRVGFLLTDLGGVSDLGFRGMGSVDEQQAIYQAYVDAANAEGGVAGRPIAAVYATYDPLSESSMRAACLELTEDQRVLVVVNTGGYIANAIRCITVEHRTPMIAGVSGAPADLYAESKGMLFTQFWNSDRMVANFANEVHRLGALQDKTVGILYDLRYGPESVARRLAQEVAALGSKVGRVSIFAADPSSASTQVPVEVSQHRAAGVDVILNMSNAIVFTQFVQEADAQRWIVPYFSSDWNGANSDFYFSNLPASFDGNLSFTVARVNEGRAGLPEPAIDAECRKRAEKAVGRSIPQDDPELLAFSRSCAYFTLLRRGLTAVGPSFTPQALSQALQSLGHFELPNMSGATLGPGRFDFGSTVRTMQWKADCKCIIPVSDFRPSKY